MATISGIRKVMWAKEPGFSQRDKFRAPSHLVAYDANGPWSFVVDDHQHGEYSETAEQQNGQTLYTSTLTFQLHPECSEADLPNVTDATYWAFQDRAGTWFLIGYEDGPHPSMTVNVDNGGSNAEVKTVTIKWRSLYGRFLLNR